MDTNSSSDRVRGAVYGMAFGDSWGFPTEFMRHGDILFVEPPVPARLQITDDTQMSLYNSRALKNILGLGLLDNLLTDEAKQIQVRKLFAEQHLEFEIDPDNGRAPGMTVMDSLHHYRRSVQLTGLEGSELNESKGCGTVMRAPWLGLLQLPRPVVALLAILQSETTHGHPQAALCSAVAALFLRAIAEGKLNLTENSPRDRLERALHASVAIANEISLLPTAQVQVEGFAQGIQDFKETTYEIIYQLSFRAEAEIVDSSSDICEIFGQGWIADEALLCAIGAFAIYGTDAYNGIKRLVYSNGDSDSIAAIGGAFFGTLIGYDALVANLRSHEVRIKRAFEPRYEIELSEAADFYSAQQ